MMPSGWRSLPLGKVITYKKGFAFKSEKFKDFGRRIIRISDTTAYDIKNDGAVFVDPDKSLNDFELNPGDIILSTVGSRPPLYDSMVGKAIKIPSTINRAYLNQNLVKLIANENVDQDFLFLKLKEPRFISYISTLVRGNANQVSITLDELFNYQVLLPSKKEQEKIAKILITWDETIEKLKLQINLEYQLLKELITSIFSENSDEISFEDLFLVVNDKSKQLKSSNYLSKGEFPIVDQGQSLICGFTNEVRNVIEDVPVIIFGDHTREIKFIDFKFAPGADGTQILKTRDGIASRLGYYALKSIKIPNLGYARHFKEIKAARFKLPKKEYQERALSILSKQDKKIQIMEKYKIELHFQKQGLMQQLLTGKKRVRI